MKFGLESVSTLSALIRKLVVGLTRLDLIDNFDSVIEEGIEIPSGTEITIRNKLTYTPTKYIITSQVGNGLITKGTTLWSSSVVSFKNNGTETVTINVILMR